MPGVRDVILKHIDAVNDRDGDADPWAADAEMTRTSASRSGSSSPTGRPQRPKGRSRAPTRWTSSANSASSPADATDPGS